MLTGLVIARPGYSPDEEITAVMAAAIGASGAPLLPSGVFYHRDIPFLYLAWLSGSLFGQSMVALRMASLICGVAGLVFALRFGVRLAGWISGFVFALLLASFPPNVAASVFARGYSALIACSVFFLLAFATWIDTRRDQKSVLFALAVATWLHPFGAALAGLPFVYAALEQGGQRSLTMRLAVSGALVVSVSMGVVYAAHFATLVIAGVEPSLTTAIYATPSVSWPANDIVALADTPLAWLAALASAAGVALVVRGRSQCHPAFIVACAICAVGFQLGVMILLLAIAIMMRPTRARQNAVCAASFAAVSLAWWSIHTVLVTDGQLNVALVLSLLRAASSYPLGHVEFTVRALPALALLSLFGCWMPVTQGQTDGLLTPRALLILALVILTAFTVGSVPVSERYLLLPWTLLAASASIGVVAIGRRSGRSVFAVLAVLLVVGDFYRYAASREALASATTPERMLAPLTGPRWRPDFFQQVSNSRDTIICTEEFACLYLIQKIDYLLALPPADTAHYVASNASTSFGFYARSPVISSRARLLEIIAVAPTRCTVVVSLNTGKVGFGEYAHLIRDLPDMWTREPIVAGDDTHVDRVCSPFR